MKLLLILTLVTAVTTAKVVFAEEANLDLNAEVTDTEVAAEIADFNASAAVPNVFCYVHNQENGSFSGQGWFLGLACKRAFKACRAVSRTKCEISGTNVRIGRGR